VLRHAKSSWAEDDQPDRERPLAPRGRKAARRVAAYLRDHGVRPDVVLCSPAERTRLTLELIQPELGDGVEVLLEDDLYGASANQLLARLRRLPDSAGTVMIVGHNPGVQELVVLLARDGALRTRARGHFPTAALATLDLPLDAWTGLQPATAELVTYVVPHELT
jgi:phosphohistidine phosphatase